MNSKLKTRLSVIRIRPEFNEFCCFKFTGFTRFFSTCWRIEMILSALLGQVLIISTILIFPNTATTQEERNLLSTIYPFETLKQILIAPPDWNPFPTANEREKWTTLPEDLRQDLITRGEKYLNFDYPSLPATLFLEYIRTGNRSHYQGERNARREALASLVIAECLEGTGRFWDDIVNGIWTICEETYWGVPAHLSLQKQGPGLPDVSEPTMDLFAGETASLLAWTYYLLGPQLDAISPLITQRIQLEIERRVLNPCLERNDFWWMGFNVKRPVNNWNPWCNSNWLTAVLIIEKDETRRVQALDKILKSLDNFINGYPDDGGCDEGPSYWNRAAASLFDCLELLFSATNGAINIYNQPIIQEMARYIYRAHISDHYFINFADASAIMTPDADIIYRYGKRIGDEHLMQFGAYWAEKRHGTITGGIGRQLPAIFNSSELHNAKKSAPLLRDVWLPGNQVMAARSIAGSDKGLYIAAQGGHNAESHNHNDVGNFIVYLNGHPMIIDVGVETYTAKTFSSRRYEIWTMQSAYHNLPTVNGVMQQAGREFAAKDVKYSMDDSFTQLQMDISGAYPEAAGIRSWYRTIRLNRAKEIIITDDYQLSQKVKDITLTLMTACEVNLVEPGFLILNPLSENDDSLYVHYDKNKLTPSLEKITIEDDRLQSVWGENVTRIILQADSPSVRDKWTIRMTVSKSITD